MKRLLFAFAIFIYCSSFSQTTVLSENFNNGFPSGWQLIDNDNGIPFNSPSVNFITDAFVIHEDYDSTGIGDSIVIANSWFDPIVDADDYLILPAVTLGPGGNVLYFDAKSIDQSYPDGIQVLYTLNDISVDSILAGGVLFDTIAAPPYWTNFSVDLDTLGLENQTVNIVFRHYATDQFILALDNIRIDINDPSSVLNIPEFKLSIYPNPCKDLVYLSEISSNKEFEIFDLQGKLVDYGYASDHIKINLKKGVYLLKIEHLTSKLIVE